MTKYSTWRRLSVPRSGDIVHRGGGFVPCRVEPGSVYDGITFFFFAWLVPCGKELDSLWEEHAGNRAWNPIPCGKELDSLWEEPVDQPRFLWQGIRFLVVGNRVPCGRESGSL